MKIFPPSEIDIKEVDRAIHGALQELLDEAEFDFNLTWKNWDNKPNWKTTQRTTKGNLEVEYSTDDENYMRVDDGTKPHKITAKNVPFLSFKVPNYPATSPGRLMSMIAGSGNTWVRAKTVNHPGITPRNFSGQVAIIIDKISEKTFDSFFLKVKSL